MRPLDPPDPTPSLGDRASTLAPNALPHEAPRPREVSPTRPREVSPTRPPEVSPTPPPACDHPGPATLPAPGRRPSGDPTAPPRRTPRTTTLALLGACHPLPSAAVTALTTALAAGAGHDAAGCARVAAAVLTGQLSVGWCNDAVDAARDRAAGRVHKPLVSGTVGVATVRAAALLALAWCVPLSLTLGTPAGALHLVALAGAWVYNLVGKSTIWSVLPYALAFGLLPACVTLSLPAPHWPAWWAGTAGALLGVGAHLANVLPDIDDDLRTGVHGGPQRCGGAAVRRLLPLPLLAATAVLALAAPARPDPAGLLTLAGATLTVALAAHRAVRHPRAPFHAAVLVAAADVALLLYRGADLG